MRLIWGVRTLCLFLERADPGEGAVKSITLFKNTKQNFDLGQVQGDEKLACLPFADLPITSSSVDISSESC